MINYLHHNGIDRQRWDACIGRSLNRRVYGYSWYLDTVCPGWEALADDDYTSVFPLTSNRKWGISYLYQPFFTQQLGLFSTKPLNGGDLDAFLRAIPLKFRYTEIQLNSMNCFNTMVGRVTMRLNHELEISRSYPELSAGYAQNTKRNIRKSQEMNVLPGNAISAAELITLFRGNFGAREGKLDDIHYRQLHDLVTRCIEEGSGHIRTATGQVGRTDAAAFFLADRDHVYFLLAASSQEARENGAMFALVDQFLEENSGKYRVLDFEGGNDPNLGRFYKSFGAAVVPYPALRINRLPGPVAAGFNLVRRLRRS